MLSFLKRFQLPKLISDLGVHLSLNKVDLEPFNLDSLRRWDSYISVIRLADFDKDHLKVFRYGEVSAILDSDYPDQTSFSYFCHSHSPFYQCYFVFLYFSELLPPKLFLCFFMFFWALASCFSYVVNIDIGNRTKICLSRNQYPRL